MSMRFPVIDPVATGKNIVRLRKERGLTVRDLQAWFGFEEPRAIYKWQRGQTLPSVDNLFALGALFQVTMDEILIPVDPCLNIVSTERQAETCRSAIFTTISIWRRCYFEHAKEASMRRCMPAGVDLFLSVLCTANYISFKMLCKVNRRFQLGLLTEVYVYGMMT